MAFDPPIGSFRIETFIMDQPYVLGYSRQTLGFWSSCRIVAQLPLHSGKMHESSLGVKQRSCPVISKIQSSI